LTFAIPSSGFIFETFKEPSLNQVFTWKLGIVDFQDLFPIPLCSSFEPYDQPLANKVVNSEKPNAVEQPSRFNLESQEPRSESNALGSLTPKETDRGRKTKKYKRER
jgi:hypothetical protein